MNIYNFVEMVSIGNKTRFDAFKNEAVKILRELNLSRQPFKRPAGLPRDPEDTKHTKKGNDKRSQWAADALAYFANDGGEPPQPGMTAKQRRGIMEQNLCDLLADLGHYCDRAGIDFPETLARAGRRYDEETGDEGQQFSRFAQAPAVAAGLDARELATVLHALRTVQCEGRIEGCAAADCEHFADVEALANEEIDTLCERLNCGDVAPAEQKPPAAPSPASAAMMEPQ